MTFCTCFPDLLSDLGEIGYNISGYYTAKGGVHKCGRQFAVATNFHDDAWLLDFWKTARSFVKHL
jgi:hypothetical protein